MTDCIEKMDLGNAFDYSNELAKKTKRTIFHRVHRITFLTIEDGLETIFFTFGRLVERFIVKSLVIDLKGWVQAVRKHKDLFFVDLGDGSCLKTLQVIIKPEGKSHPTYGDSITVNGSLVKSEHKSQDVELQCSSWNIIGSCSAKDYPFSARQHHPPQYTRQFLHLRPRTRTFAAVLRIRNAATMAIHNFFQDRAFQFIHTPIISSNDCEGAGEVFTIKAGNKDTNIKQVSPTEIPISEEKEFFNVPTYLTVSGQLHLEAVACALSRVYSFGPVFRAENTRTRHHLSEFYMVEAEIAFIESLDVLTKFVENIYKYTAQHVLDTCSDDVDWLCNVFTSKYKDNIQQTLHKPFICISYTEAISILEKYKNALEVNIKWGDDLLTEHEQFLIQHCNNTPVFITHFPSSIKPFYMKEETDSTASCFDLLAPFGGEICGGSLRETNEEILKNKLETLNMIKSLEWYMDLRKFGSVPHGGFGIGFERLLQSILGIPNIREVFPFPRWTHHCQL